MASDRKPKASNSIPIRFFDADGSPLEPDDEAAFEEHAADMADELEERESEHGTRESRAGAGDPGFGGPEFAELIASRAELKRLQATLAETQEALARRQADFDNYRKRIERERHEIHNRLVADVARKLLPVVDNLARALEAERSVEASESPEFRHFLHGVELISKQLNEVLESLGVQPIPAVGERFDPHIHEAVVTEPSDEFEPDTVVEEMARGYRIGDRLLRPAMVKVAARSKDEETDDA